jgi:tRNA wybutosine-synthesizing protein 3
MSPTGPSLTYVYHTTVYMLGRLWVFGGRSATGSAVYNDIRCLDIEGWQWSSVDVGPVKPKSRYYHTAAALRHRMYVFGGRDHDDRFGDLHAFDPLTLTWSQPNTTGTMPGIHSGHSCCAIGSKMFIHGGFGGTAMLDEMYILDIDTMVWSKPKLLNGGPPGRYLHTMSPIGSTIFMFGGCSAEGHVNELYSFETDYPPSLKSQCIEVVCRNLAVLPPEYEKALPTELVDQIQHNLRVTHPSPATSFWP